MTPVRRIQAKRLGAALYRRGALTLAPLLLGKILCRNINGRLIRLRITETEAYCGEADTACHASKGKTERTGIMYERGGFAYIYLCYGIHWMLNVVSGKKDFPEAVLIRGVEGFDGPGKLTKALSIDKSLNKEDLIVSDKLWIEDDGSRCEHTASTRVGIDYAAEKDRQKLWRFTIRQKRKKRPG